MDASITPEETLADVLGARARHTPIDRLVLDIVGGALIALAALWARPTAWFPLGVAAMCVSCYGVWALSERRLHAAPGETASEPSRVWRLARQAAAVGGVSSFVTLLFALLGVALGPIKS